MWVGSEQVNTSNGGQKLYINIMTARTALADMIESNELPPSLKPSVNIERMVADLRNVEGKGMSFYDCFSLEFERCFGVHVGLSLNFKKANETIEGTDRTLEVYTFKTELSACGTRYDLVSAIALNTLQARVIEFASALECMFGYPICEVKMKEVAEA